MSTPLAPRDVRFIARDGTPLAGSFFAAEAPHTLLVLNSGTGIPRGFYRRFASHAARRGFAVLTYDYRGIGGSAPPDLATSTAVYRDWGQLDVPAAIDWAHEQLPDHPLVVVAHSTGGQQLGLASNVATVDAAAFVCVSTGYWRGLPLRMQAFTLLLWKLMVPIACAVYGYFPARRFGLGESLPAGVATEWGAWCMHPDYHAAFFDGTGRRRSADGRPFGPHFFAEATFPIRALCFTDDTIATPANVPALMELYASADVDVRWTDPREAGLGSVGHLGFFRAAAAGLWDETLDWLRDAARPSGHP